MTSWAQPHDNTKYPEMDEAPPYRDIYHTLCGVNSIVQWRDERTPKSTLPYTTTSTTKKLLKTLDIKATKDVEPKNDAISHIVHHY